MNTFLSITFIVTIVLISFAVAMLIFEDFFVGAVAGFFAFCFAMFFVIYFGITIEDRDRIEAKNILDKTPYTTKIDMGDGCILHQYFGDGSRARATTKYIKCDGKLIVDK